MIQYCSYYRSCQLFVGVPYQLLSGDHTTVLMDHNLVTYNSLCIIFYGSWKYNKTTNSSLILLIVPLHIKICNKVNHMKSAVERFSSWLETKLRDTQTENIYSKYSHNFKAE